MYMLYNIFNFIKNWIEVNFKIISFLNLYIFISNFFGQKLNDYRKLANKISLIPFINVKFYPNFQ